MSFAAVPYIISEIIITILFSTTIFEKILTSDFRTFNMTVFSMLTSISGQNLPFPNVKLAPG